MQLFILPQLKPLNKIQTVFPESNRHTRESHQHKRFWASGVFGATTKMSSMPWKLTNINSFDEVVCACFCLIPYFVEECSHIDHLPHAASNDIPASRTSQHRNGECLRQNHSEQQLRSSHMEKRIANAAGCSHSLTVFNMDSSMHMWNNPTQKKHVEPESATDAARLDSSGCATVTMKYDHFLDDCHLETAKLYLGKFGGRL